MLNSNADICKKAVDREFIISGGYSAEFYGWTAKTADIGNAIQQIPNPQSFLVWESRFKNQVTTCSDFPSDAMLWIKEVQMVDSLDAFKSSRSVSGKNFQKNRDAGREDCFCSEHDHPEFPVQEEGQSRGTEIPKEDRGSQIAVMIYDYFWVTGAHDTVLDYADLFSITLHDNVQDFDTRWDEVPL